MKHSYGFIIRSRDKYLICHPYGSDWKNGSWSLPKGGSKKDESSLEAAIRETEEETGINLNKYKGKITEIGTFDYPKKNKKITIFSFTGNENLYKVKPYCKSFISKGKYKGKPEIDLSLWVPLENAKERLGSFISAIIDKFIENENNT